MRFRGSIAGLIIGCLAAFGASGAAQAETEQSASASRAGSVSIRTEGSSTGNTIVVTGDRELEKDRVRNAVRDIAMRGRSQFSPLSQFQDPLCINVSGFGRELGQRIASRIVANTRLVGFKVADPGCTPNAIVIMVDNPERLIERIREERPDLINVAASRRIRATVNSAYPAISWTINEIRGSRGTDLENSTAIAGGVIGGNAADTFAQTDAWRASRTAIPFSVAQLVSVVVFDAYKMDNVHLDQISDYATVRILGNPQPRAELDEAQPDTILNLFRMDPLDAAPGLTLIDLAYLRGLYSMHPNDPSNRLEHFVLTAYDGLRDSDCAGNGPLICTDAETTGSAPAQP